jgi:hypothetical protein
MSDAPRTTSYLSRILAVTPVVAARVFDASSADRQARSSLRHRWSVASGSDVVLVLDGSADDAPPWVLRSCPGRLRTGRFARPVAVELELTAWSSGESELGLRLPRGRELPSRRYFDAAGAVIDDLASELELRGLLATHPDHGTGADSSSLRAVSPGSKPAFAPVSGGSPLRDSSPCGGGLPPDTPATGQRSR